MNHETSQDMNYIIIQLTTNNIWLLLNLDDLALVIVRKVLNSMVKNTKEMQIENTHDLITQFYQLWQHILEFSL
jgi:hypothetical protein